MRTLTLTLFFISLSTGFFAQNLEIPKNYKFEKTEDYAPYEQDVVNCINWLMATPINEQTQKRSEANAFVLQWLMGCPYVHIEIKPEIVNFIGETPDLLTTFIGGWAKYSIESKDYDNKAAGNLAGIESVIEFYKKNKKQITKDKNVENYIKMKEKGTLKDYVDKNA